MPVLHRYKYSDNHFILTNMNGAVVTFQLTNVGEQRLIDAGIEPGEQFGRALLLDLCRSGEAFTNGAASEEDLSGWTQTELDFVNDPEPETLLPTCAECLSPYDLYLVSIVAPNRKYISVRCESCRDKDVATIGICVPTPLVSRSMLNRLITLSGIVVLDSAGTRFKHLLESEFVQKWDNYKRKNAKAVQANLFAVTSEVQGALL